MDVLSQKNLFFVDSIEDDNEWFNFVGELDSERIYVNRCCGSAGYDWYGYPFNCFDTQNAHDAQKIKKGFSYFVIIDSDLVSESRIYACRALWVRANTVGNDLLRMWT